MLKILKNVPLMQNVQKWEKLLRWRLKTRYVLQKQRRWLVLLSPCFTSGIQTYKNPALIYEFCFCVCCAPSQFSSIVRCVGYAPMCSVDEIQRVVHCEMVKSAECLSISTEKEVSSNAMHWHWYISRFSHHLLLLPSLNPCFNLLLNLVCYRLKPSALPPIHRAMFRI